MLETDNIYMIGSSLYKWYQSYFPTLMWGSIPFDPAIPWDTIRTLCLYRGCLSHPTSDKGKTFWHYISIDFSQPSRCVLKP